MHWSSSRRAVALKISLRKLSTSVGKNEAQSSLLAGLAHDVGQTLLVEAGLVDDPGARFGMIVDELLELERVADARQMWAEALVPRTVR